ncbi:MAG: pyridoxal 5'-phosphate synthase glutaminase subunit PdxT [Dehalococcoidales bacterium]|nr:pyridoxal 5'-phosphate synthase glutaminase subunit PdxT [Dehalococcoidales bacterium]
MKIGVLASQGAFIEHIITLNKLDIEAMPVRLPVELKGVDGLIIPGGESTTISRLMDSYKLAEEITALARDGMPVFGTCAGMILMASEISGNTTRSLGLMDITVKRNAFGRQVDSFETDLKIPVLGEKPFPAVFIRAPIIERYSNNVEVLARLDDNTAVAARQDKLLGMAFHPELTNDLRFHKYFLEIVTGKRN